MKFITETPFIKQLTLEEVDINQFFVNPDGQLCQKMGSTAYIIIADHNGEPYADYFDSVHPQHIIKRIMPKVTKVEF